MSKKISFCAMMAVLGVLSLAATLIFPANKIFFYCFSTLFTYICVEEYGIKYGLLTYAVISCCGFLIVSNKLAIGAYAIIIGYYPIIKHLIEHMGAGRLIKWLLKTAFVSAAAAAAYLLLGGFLSFSLSPILIFLAGLIIFFIYDFALTVGLRFYALRLRKHR